MDAARGYGRCEPVAAYSRIRLFSWICKANPADCISLSPPANKRLRSDSRLLNKSRSFEITQHSRFIFDLSSSYVRCSTISFAKACYKLYILNLSKGFDLLFGSPDPSTKSETSGVGAGLSAPSLHTVVAEVHTGTRRML